ncbi:MULTISPECIES: outer membrane protein transport protein [unclassified Vibrio]|uniref:Outer membrane protein transport protein n=1 Tax=Vibrio sp. HB236076 TaxID=3232307 RepID=A0AB39HEM3_9VIBR|nr:outer membrane protein transport protein [Vibrio sp. HB161653]MDP5252997.1 outer membrane protein transport protein [Vibrio sp. HB161653]
MKKLQKTLVASSVLLATQAFAAGFQVNEHSASGLGRAFSGEGAVADNASVIARNPAAMTLFDSAEFSGALSYIDPEIDVTNKTNGQESKDVAPSQIVPAAYYLSPINEQWAWGIGLFTYYGVATDYPDDTTAGTNAGDTSLVSVNLNPSLAYRIDEQWSVGAGLNLVYAKAELNRTYGDIGASVGASASDNFVSMEGSTWGYGWNVGAMYEYNEHNRFAATYRSKVDLEFDGDYSNSLFGVDTEAELDVPLPAIFELSAYHRLNESWAIHYGWQWTEWSDFTDLTASSDNCTFNAGTCFNKDESYEDNNRYSIGATYFLNPNWILRAGFAYDEQAGKSTLSIPDTDRYWYSAGFTYIHNPKWSVDVGMTLIDTKDIEFDETSSSGVTYDYSSEGITYIGAVQVNYKFD